jgi:hypothetical protein
MGIYVLLGYLVFIFCFFAIGNLVLFAIEKLIIFCIEHLKEFIHPTPKLTKEQMVEIAKKANNFIHSKHRPWMYDDTFAEYLNLVNEMAISKQKELSRNC